MPSTDSWPADVKAADGGRIDPNVLPEYTLLPTSPPQSVVSYDEPQARIGSSFNPNGDSGSPPAAPTANPNSCFNSNTADADVEAQAAPTCGTESLRIAKLLYIGMLALAIPPVFLACMGLAMGAVALYGCGKVLEGFGRALAFAPETVYRAWVAKRATRFLRAVRVGENLSGAGVREEEEVVEGQVALDDVEAQAGQGGPISI